MLAAPIHTHARTPFLFPRSRHPLLSTPILSTRRPFVCIFKLNRLYAAIPQFYAASSCPHYRVKPVREIQSATISATGGICNRVAETAVETRASWKGDVEKGILFDFGEWERREEERRDSCFARILYLKREKRGEGRKKIYREKRTEKTIYI